MLFQLKKKKQKSSQDPTLSPKVDKIKTILKKVKFVARNVIYVKKWSKNSPLLQKIKTKNNSHIKSKKLNFHHGSIELRIIDDTDELMYKVKKLRYESFFGESDKNKYDSDEFDKSCDHLVAIDKSISDDYIVGTYRLLLKPKFVKSQKFSKAYKHFSDIYTSFQGRNLNRAINCLEGINKLPNRFNFSSFVIFLR